jgi:hypothetical protein
MAVVWDLVVFVGNIFPTFPVIDFLMEMHFCHKDAKDTKSTKVILQRVIKPVRKLFLEHCDPDFFTSFSSLEI